MKPEGRGIMEAKGVGREDSVRQRELHMKGQWQRETQQPNGPGALEEQQGG